MVSRGFEGITKNVDQQFRSVDQHFRDVNRQLFEVNQRLGRIEKDILEDYGNRIEILESKVKELMSKVH